MCESISSAPLSSENDISSWITPHAVMKSRKLKARRHALNARMNGSLPILAQNKTEKCEDGDLFHNLKRNPFRRSSTSSASSLLLDDEITNKTLKLFNSRTKDITTNFFTVSNQLNSDSNIKETQNLSPTKNQPELNTSSVLCVDWALKSRLRIYSPHPFPWKDTFKTSEEASGTTGFVRCLNSFSETPEQKTLDTSSNARLYQCCLFWQSPNLPLVPLFPRKLSKSPSGHGGIYGSDPSVSRALYAEWSESLRSLYQLLRVRQCPFFYMCTSTFTCIFRAAGVAGFPHNHALIVPTTKGFRNALRNEDVEFSMPLLKTTQRMDSGDPELQTEDENEDSADFLEALGVEASQFPTLVQNRHKTEKNDSEKVRGMDGTTQSLVYVEDVELQGLVNFFLNCNSCVSTTGLLAGVPPTMLSPVAFHGATLKSLKVSEGAVRTASGDIQYSFDITGPVLPTTVLHLSSLLRSSMDSFSLSLSPVLDTISFGTVSPSPSASPLIPMAFASEGLIDCGLDERIREVLCMSPCQPGKSNLPATYRNVKYSGNSFTWSDR